MNHKILNYPILNSPINLNKYINLIYFIFYVTLIMHLVYITAGGTKLENII